MIQLLTIIASAVLWHLGGQGHKWCRQIIGGVIGLSKWIITGNVWAMLYWLLLWALVQGVSYGLSAPPHKFWVWVFGKGSDGNTWYVELATRMTCGLAWSLAGWWFAVLNGNFVNAIVYTIVCTIGVGLLGLHKKVEISELGTGAVVGLSVLI